MADSSNRKDDFKPGRLLIILISISLFLLLMSSFSDSFNNLLRKGVDTVLMPMQKGMNTLGSRVFGSIEELSELRRVQEENETLKKQLEALRKENVSLKLEQAEVETLRELLALKEQYPSYEAVAAHIIGKNSGNWYQSFLIDKGTDDGLALNMNVLAGGGLVGVITSIGDSYATVSTIINEGQYVSAMSSRTLDLCLVKGDLGLYESGKLSVGSFGKHADVQKGDMLVTSNVSDLYLPGILIGYVDTVEVDASRLTQSGTLLPVVDFDKLTTVLVVTTLKTAGK